MPAYDELPVVGGELAQGQPVDVGLQQEQDAHHIPDIRVQVVHQLTVLRQTDPVEGPLDVPDEVVEVLPSGLPLRSTNFPLLLVVRRHHPGVGFQPVEFS